MRATSEKIWEHPVYMSVENETKLSPARMGHKLWIFWRPMGPWGPKGE